MATDDSVPMKEKGSSSGDGGVRLDVPSCSANNSSSRADLVVDKHGNYEMDEGRLNGHNTK